MLVLTGSPPLLFLLVAGRRKLLLATVSDYLALPFDPVPDFIPLAGLLDDALVLALALRGLLGDGNEPLLREHWPGPARLLELVPHLGGQSPLSAAREA